MSKPDISALSIDQLNELMVEAKNLAIKKRAENLKALVDDLLQKSKAMNFENSEVIAEIKSREAPVGIKKSKASNSSKAEPIAWKKDVVYCNPEDQTKEWIGGNRGPKPPWLAAIISKSRSHADLMAKYAELVKK